MCEEKTTDLLQGQKPSLMSNLAFCLRSTLECYPPLLLGCLLAILSGTAIPVISTFLPKIIIEKILLEKSLESMVFAAVGLTLSLAFLSGTKYFLDKFLYHHKYKMNTYYTEKVALKGMSADYRNQETDRFRKLHTESLLSCSGNYSALTSIYEVCVSLGSSALGFLLYFGILVRLNLLLLLFLILTTLVSWHFNNQIIRWARENEPEKVGYLQRARYITSVSADLKSAKDIRLYQMNGWLNRTYQNHMDLIASWQNRYTKKVFQAATADSGLAMLRDLAAYAYLLYLVFSSRITVADFVLYFGVISGFSGWLGDMLGHTISLKRISMSVSYLRAFLTYPDTCQREGGIEPPLDAPSIIEFRDVSYRYENARNDTLSHLNLTISPGEHLAVVGLNGAGKTTLVKLLTGLVDPTEGSVCYNGTDVRKYNRTSFYRLFSAVFQQFSLLPVTFAEIVAESTEHIDRAKVEDCLRTAGLWDKISSLSKGIDSEYGKTIRDGGTELSGGEIQKLLFARALYRSAPVMVLDEPTAALDALAESRLYERYHEVIESRTAVFISHRLASTRFCDRILLIADGSIVEEGTHEELLQKGGFYQKLYETQARYYQEGGDLS